MAHSTSRRRILDVFSADQHLYTLPGTLNFPKHTHTLDFAIQSSRTGANWVYPPRRRSFVTAADTTCLGLLVSSLHVPTACLATCTVSPPPPPSNQIVSHLILTNSVFSRSPAFPHSLALLLPATVLHYTLLALHTLLYYNSCRQPAML